MTERQIRLQCQKVMCATFNFFNESRKKKYTYNFTAKIGLPAYDISFGNRDDNFIYFFVIKNESRR